MKIPINEETPVIYKRQIEINTPISIVWNILTSLDNWPKWQGGVTEVKITDQILEGTNFVWKAGGLTFNSQIHTMVFLGKFR